jgi:hypothetical protein
MRHEEAVPGPFCPVKGEARRVSYITHQLQLPPLTPLSTVRPPLAQIRATDILSAVRASARRANLAACCYYMSRIGAHSLRASGAMALWLSGHSAKAILKYHGHWKSNTFLTYIHFQIAAISQGAAQKIETSHLVPQRGRLAPICTARGLPTSGMMAVCSPSRAPMRGFSHMSCVGRRLSQHRLSQPETLPALLASARPAPAHWIGPPRRWATRSEGVVGGSR